MKIRRVRSFLLSYPFPEPLVLPFYGGSTHHRKAGRHADRSRDRRRPRRLWSRPGQRDGAPGDRSDHRAFPGRPYAGRSGCPAGAVFGQGPGSDPETRENLLRRGSGAVRPCLQASAVCRCRNCSGAASGTASAYTGALVCTWRRKGMPRKPAASLDWDFMPTKCGLRLGPEQRSGNGAPHA